jgi:hypothetical protein
MKLKSLYILFFLLACFSSCERSNCHNGIKDDDEIGVDCGGICPECPPTVETLFALEITDTSAFLSMKYQGNTNTTFYSKGICFSTSPEPTIYDSYIGFLNSGSYPTDGDYEGYVRTLQPNTKYYLRGFVKDDKAIAYGNELSFTTNSLVLSLASVFTNPVTTVTQTTAISGGNITGDGKSPVTARGICYSSTTNNPTIVNTIIAGGSGLGSFNSDLIGLTPSTTYYVRAFATNGIGTAYGNPVSFTTTDITIPAIATKPAASITPTTAISGGDVSSNGGATITSRGICYNTSGNPTTASNVISSGNGLGSFYSDLVGLTPSTTYYVRSFATNSVGTAYGNQISFITISPFTIGQSYGGGTIVSIDSSGLHGLIMTPSRISTGGMAWSKGDNSAVGITKSSIGSGMSNTNAIISHIGNTGTYPAKLCADLVLNGYSDWYLPSKDELEQLHINSASLDLASYASILMLWSSTETEFGSNSAYEFYWSTSLSTFFLQGKNSTYSVVAFRSF